MNILMIGGYGYNDVGDEAQPHAIIDNLYKELGKDNFEIVMLSPNPEFTKNYHGEKSEKDIVFKAHKLRYFAFGKNANRKALIRDYSYILFWAWCKKRLKIKLPLRNDVKKIIKRIEWSDVIINSGGGNLNSIMLKELLKRTSVHRIAKLFGKKVYISNQTIGPFYYKKDMKIAKKAIDKVDLLTFRDKEISMKRCRDIGVQSKNIFDAADDAISLYNIPDQEAINLIKKDAGESWFNIKADFIFAINIKASLTVFKGKDRDSSLEPEINSMVKITEYILNKYNSKVLFVSTDFCEGVDDREYLKKIRDKLQKELLPKTALLEKEYTDYELKGILGNVDFALGARYHFTVFALGRFVPTIGIASGEYQMTKLKGIAELCELPEYYIDEELDRVKFEKVYKAIDNLIVNKKEIELKLKSIVPDLIERSKMPVYRIKDYFQNR